MLKKIQESGEMYLETILILSRELSVVRSIDIAEHLGYSKPSVSRGVSLLREGGLIELTDKSAISLTTEGKKAAERIFERHQCLSALLKRLGVSEETATEDACRIEHVISDEAFDKIKEWVTKN